MEGILEQTREERIEWGKDLRFLEKKEERRMRDEDRLRARHTREDVSPELQTDLNKAWLKSFFRREG